MVIKNEDDYILQESDGLQEDENLSEGEGIEDVEDIDDAEGMDGDGEDIIDEEELEGEEGEGEEDELAQEDEAELADAEDEEKKKKKRMFAILGGVAAAAVAIVLLLMFGLNKPNNGDANVIADRNTTVEGFGDGFQKGGLGENNTTDRSTTTLLEGADASTGIATGADSEGFDSNSTIYITDQSKIDELAAELRRMKDEANRYKDLLDDAINSVGNMGNTGNEYIDSQVNGIKDELTHAASDNADLLAQIAALEKAIAEGKVPAGALDALKEKLLQNEKTIQSLRDRINTLKSYIATSDLSAADIEKLTKDLDALRNKLNNLQAENTRLETIINQFKESGAWKEAVQKEQEARENAITKEEKDRTDAINKEADDRTAAINKEEEGRKQAVSDEEAGRKEADDALADALKTSSDKINDRIEGAVNESEKANKELKDASEKGDKDLKDAMDAADDAIKQEVGELDIVKYKYTSPAEGASDALVVFAPSENHGKVKTADNGQ